MNSKNKQKKREVIHREWDDLIDLEKEDIQIAIMRHEGIISMDDPEFQPTFIYEIVPDKKRKKGRK